jgi:DNA-binding transcriptional ArsR family regulator
VPRNGPLELTPLDKAARYTRLVYALCDLTRMSFLLRLDEDGEVASGELRATPGASRNPSKHIQVLVAAGLIEGRRESRNTYYSLSRAGSRLVDMINEMAEVVAREG